MKNLKRPHQKESVVLFGNANDPEIQASLDKIKVTGRNVTIEVRPGYDSGTGPCGKKQCSCKNTCEAFVGDTGPLMGNAY